MIDDEAHEMSGQKDAPSPTEQFAQRHLSPGVIDAAKAGRQYDRALWVAQRSSVTGRLLQRFRSFEASGAHPGSLTFFGRRRAHPDGRDESVTVVSGSYSGAESDRISDELNPGAAVATEPGQDRGAAQPAAIELQRRLVSRSESAGVVPVQQVRRLYERTLSGTTQRHELINRLQARTRKDNENYGSHSAAPAEGVAEFRARAVTPEIQSFLRADTMLSPALSESPARGVEEHSVSMTQGPMIEQARKAGHDTPAAGPAMRNELNNLGDGGQGAKTNGEASAEDRTRKLPDERRTYEAAGSTRITTELARHDRAAAVPARQIFRLSRKKAFSDNGGADNRWTRPAAGSETQCSGEREGTRQDPEAPVRTDIQPSDKSLSLRNDSRSIASQSQDVRKTGTAAVNHGPTVQPETLNSRIRVGIADQSGKGGRVLARLADVFAAGAAGGNPTDPANAGSRSSADNTAEGESRLLFRKQGDYREASGVPAKTENRGQSVSTAAEAHGPYSKEIYSSVYASQARTPAADVAPWLILRAPARSSAESPSHHEVVGESSLQQDRVPAVPSAHQNKSADSGTQSRYATAVSDAQAAPGPLSKGEAGKPLVLRKPARSSTESSSHHEVGRESFLRQDRVPAVPSAHQNKSADSGTQSRYATAVSDAQAAPGPLSKGAAAKPLVLRKPARSPAESSSHHEVVRESAASGRGETDISQERSPFIRSLVRAEEKNRISTGPGAETAHFPSIHRETSIPLVQRFRQSDRPIKKTERSASNVRNSDGLQAAAEIPARSVHLERSAMVWRMSNQQPAAAASPVIFRNTGAAAGAAASTGSTAAAVETAGPTGSPQQTGAGTSSAAFLDFEMIAEQVSRLLCRRLETERERQGAGW